MMFILLFIFRFGNWGFPLTEGFHVKVRMCLNIYTTLTPKIKGNNQCIFTYSCITLWSGIEIYPCG